MYSKVCSVCKEIIDEEAKICKFCKKDTQSISPYTVNKYGAKVDYMTVNKTFFKNGSFRYVAFLFWALIPVGLILDMFTMIPWYVSVVFFFIGAGFTREYKCPVCNKVINLNVNPSKINRCPNCYVELNRND